MKSLLKIVKFDIRTFYILKSFNGWKFMFLDLVHKVPESLVFQCDFLNLVIKESIFDVLNNPLKCFPIL